MRVPLLSGPFLIPLVCAETWKITSLNTHFMGKNSGIADGTWPDSEKFNSSITFTLERSQVQPANTTKTVNCSGNFNASAELTGYKYADSTAWMFCDQWSDNHMKFLVEGLDPEGDLGSFQLISMWEEDLVLHGSPVHGFNNTVAITSVTSNNASNPASFLTCHGGEPFDGIRCQMNGASSVPGPIILEPEEFALHPVGSSASYISYDFHISDVNMIIRPNGSNSSYRTELQFNIVDLGTDYLSLPGDNDTYPIISSGIVPCHAVWESDPFENPTVLQQFCQESDSTEDDPDYNENYRFSVFVLPDFPTSGNKPIAIVVERLVHVDVPAFVRNGADFLPYYVWGFSNMSVGDQLDAQCDRHGGCYLTSGARAIGIGVQQAGLGFVIDPRSVFGTLGGTAYESRR